MGKDTLGAAKPDGLPIPDGAPISPVDGEKDDWFVVVVVVVVVSGANSVLGWTGVLLVGDGAVGVSVFGANSVF